MKEKICIKNFGGIKEMTLEINDITILIGPQASGKSVTAKLVYFFREFMNGFELLPYPTNDLPVYIEYVNKQFVKKFPKSTWPEKSFCIEYHINGNIIYFNKEKGIYYSGGFLKLFQEIIAKHADLKQQNLINKEYIINHQYYIPSGRSITVQLLANAFNIMKANLNLDPFDIDFGRLYQASLGNTDLFFDLKNTNSIEKSVIKIINGSIQMGIDDIVITTKDNRKIPIKRSSSGQQEIIPLIQGIRQIKKEQIRGENLAVYLEEPEAHLFPIAQYDIVRLLSRVLRDEKTYYNLIITTHSPYILTAFNNLIQAGRIERDKPELREELYKLVPKEEIIAPEKLTCYSLENGTGKAIMDEETGLIQGNMIDEASDIIGEQFDKLLDLEYGV